VQWRARRLIAMGPGVAFYLPYRNRASGQNSLPVCVYDASAPLKAGQSVALGHPARRQRQGRLGLPVAAHLPGNNQQRAEAGT
jgi:hypothetical protein